MAGRTCTLNRGRKWVDLTPEEKPPLPGPESCFSGQWGERHERHETGARSKVTPAIYGVRCEVSPRVMRLMSEQPGLMCL